jgi:hypothetical protein
MPLTPERCAGWWPFSNTFFEELQFLLGVTGVAGVQELQNGEPWFARSLAARIERAKFRSLEFNASGFEP